MSELTAFQLFWSRNTNSNFQMNVLITGANGFLGKEFIKYFSLSEDYVIFSTSRNELDVCDEKAVSSFLQNKEIDIVLHTAIKGGKRGIQDTKEDFIKNLLMFDNLKRNSDKYKLMINFGSGAAFDKDLDIDNVKEEGVFDRLPKDFYGLAKNLITRQIIGFNENIINLRLFGCFGTSELKTRFIKSIIDNYKNKKPVIIDQPKEMDFFFVEDLCRVIKYYIENFEKKQLPNDLNMCYNKQKLTLREIATLVHSEGNIENKILFNGNNKGSSYTGDSSRLESLTIDLIGLKNGIKKVLSEILYE
jgi:UDP-glucose 4-epimerase